MQFSVCILNARRSNQSILKEISPEYSFIGRTDAEAETPILWPPDAKSWLIGKDPDSGKDWRQEEKGTTVDEMVGWHHDSMDMSLSRLQQFVLGSQAWRVAVHGVTKSQTHLSNWTELNTSKEIRGLFIPIFSTPDIKLKVEKKMK